jgi:hypothetical protein
LRSSSSAFSTVFGAIRTIVPSTEYPSLFARRMMSSAWSHGTSRSATSTVPCTAGSMTMFKPLISANVRSTARRSAPWKSRLIGWPVNCRPREPVFS